MVCFGSLFDFEGEVAGAQIIWNKLLVNVRGLSSGAFHSCSLRDTRHPSPNFRKCLKTKNNDFTFCPSRWHQTAFPQDSYCRRGIFLSTVRFFLIYFFFTSAQLKNHHHCRLMILDPTLVKTAGKRTHTNAQCIHTYRCTYTKKLLWNHKKSQMLEYDNNRYTQALQRYFHLYVVSKFIVKVFWFMMMMSDNP